MDLERLADAIQELAGPKLMSAGGGTYFLARPDSTSTEDVERFLPKPNRKRATVTLFDPVSFSGYLTRFKEAETVVFADQPSRKAVAEIDYHGAEPENAVGSEPSAASWRSHKAVFAPKLDEAYAQWAALDGKELRQKDLLEFLEDRAADVVTPDFAALSEMVMAFQAVRKVTFKSSHRLRDGLRAFSYKEEDQAEGQAILPEYLFVALPIFARQEPREIKVAVRFNFDDGSLRFRLVIHNREIVEQQAFDRLMERVAADHPDMPIYDGVAA